MQNWFALFTRVPRAVTPPLLWSVVDSVARTVGLITPEPASISIEHVPEALLLVRTDGRIAVANTQAGRLFGRSAAELSELPLDTLFRIAPSEPAPGVFELFAVRRNGEQFCADVRAEVVWIGTDAFVIAMVRDVEERRGLERERRGDERRLRLALETGQIGTWAVDIHSGTAIWDERLHHMFGLRPGSFRGTFEAFLELVHADDRAKVADIVMRGMQESGPHEIEFRAVLPDGAVRHLSSRADLVHDERGRASRIAGVCIDVTERVQTQQRLQRARDELERSVGERTQALNRTLQELDDFAHIVSHDLKEPLRGIFNYARFVMEDENAALAAESRQKLERISHLANRMNDLIDSILQTARVGHLAMEQNVDVGKLVADVAISLESMLGEQNAEFRAADSFPSIACDPQRITEVIRNLVTNAIKYNDKSRKIVEVGATKLDSSRAPVFYVRDNGIGIAHEYFGTIFEMFKRLHPPDAFGGGSGAGLAIAKKIVELHGGRLWLESEPGQGSTFYFTVGDGVSAGYPGLRTTTAAQRAPQDGQGRG